MIRFVEPTNSSPKKMNPRTSQPRNKQIIAALALTIAVGAPKTLPASTLVVDPTTGPYTTIQAALNSALAGDTVLVHPGTYRERVSFVSGGNATQPVILQGQEGAVIDGGQNITLNWSAVPAGEISGDPPGVYKAAISGFTPRTLIADGKWITPLDFNRCTTTWQGLFANGTGSHGWDGVRAIWMHHPTNGVIYIRFMGDLNPANMVTSVAPVTTPCIDINGKDYCTVRGLDIRNGYTGVAIANSMGSVVENCKIGPTSFGVYLNAGADRCVIRYNEIKQDPYFGANPWREAAWDSWVAVKSYGYYNTGAVTVGNSKGGHEIYDNYIHDHWDGIESSNNASRLLGDKMHHNYFFTLFDNTVKLSYSQANNELNNNIMEVGRVGTRISNPDPGPLFIYQNIYIENKSDVRIQTGSGGALPLAEVWFYHNTCMSDTSVNLEWDNYPLSHTPNYYFYNNIFWGITCQRPSNYAPVDWHGNFNVYVKANPGERPFPAEWDTLSSSTRLSYWNNGHTQMTAASVDLNSAWLTTGLPGFTNSAERDLSLLSTSVAKDAGMNLSVGQPRSLPGCPTGYFSGSAPDCGALEYGQPMPLLPRIWTRTDVGAVSAAGTFDLNSGVFTVEGSGADISHTQLADEFCYVFQPASGDCEMIARVVSLENTNSWAKGGVMIRESLASGSKHAFMSFAPVSSSGYAFIRRLNTNGTAATNAGAGYSLPYWVKITRVGDTFSAARSTNGTTWYSVGTPQTISMSPDVYIGLAVTSKSDGTPCTAVFDNVKVSP